VLLLRRSGGRAVLPARAPAPPPLVTLPDWSAEDREESATSRAGGEYRLDVFQGVIPGGEAADAGPYLLVGNLDLLGVEGLQQFGWSELATDAPKEPAPVDHPSRRQAAEL
jgi:hypothetical protein